LNTKEEDFVTTFLTTSAHSDLLFFTDRGKAYQIKMYDVPEGRRATKGKSIMNFLSLTAEENITSILAMPKDVKSGVDGLSLLLVTKQGVAKRVSAENFYDVRKSGLVAIKLSDGDQLVSATFAEKKDEAMVATTKGQSIHFKASDIREMGRSATGVRVMKLQKDDFIISAGVVSSTLSDPRILVLSEVGYGKRTKLKEYKVQNRGGSGIKTANVTAKTGKLISARIGDGNEGELVVISKKGQVIRVDLKEIPTLGRQTQGVRIMKMRAGDSIASLIVL
jgi:DNA gyrase subunit A